MDTRALSFGKLYKGLKIRVGTGEQILGALGDIFSDHTIAIVMDVRDDRFYVLWNHRPVEQYWTSLHFSQVGSFRRC